MPKRRDMIKMSDTEIRDFIAGQKNIQVATINKDGTPHLTVLWFAIVDGAIVLETFTKSQKVKNLQRDPRITVLLEDGDSYEELRGVSIKGRAELIQDVETVHKLHVAVLLRNNEGLDEKTANEVSAGMAAKKTAIVIQPDRYITWDHRKLNVSY